MALKLYAHMILPGAPPEICVLRVDPTRSVGQVHSMLVPALGSFGENYMIGAVKAHPGAETGLSQSRAIGNYFENGDDLFCELIKKETPPVQKTEEPAAEARV